MSNDDREEYEFTEEQNTTLRELVRHMLITTLALVIASVITFIVGISDNFYYYELIAGIATATIGISLFFPIDNFKAVYQTKGE